MKIKRANSHPVEVGTYFYLNDGALTLAEVFYVNGHHGLFYNLIGYGSDHGSERVSVTSAEDWSELIEFE